MASGFSPNDFTCKRCSRKDKLHVTYRIEVDEKLCDGCADVIQGSIKTVTMRALLFCEKHSHEEAKIFCQSHDIGICHICATTKPHDSCEKRDINDEIAERKYRVVDLVQKGKINISELWNRDAFLVDKLREAEEHIKALEEQITEGFEEGKDDADRQNTDAVERINTEAEREIAKINKFRNERLATVNESYNKKIARLNLEKMELAGNLEDARHKFQKKCISLKSQNGRLSSLIHETVTQAEKLVTPEENLLKYVQPVTNSLIESMKESEVLVQNADGVGSVIEKISFRRGEGKTIGRVGLPSWVQVHVDDFNTGLGNHSWLIGSVKHDEVVIRDLKGSLHVSNLTTRVTREIIEGQNPHFIVTFASLADGKKVCGTRTGEIVIYDQKWKQIRNINIAGGKKDFQNKFTYVATDKDGMIYAVLHGANTIQVYHSSNGALVRSVKVHDKKIHEIQVFSSENIVIRSQCSTAGCNDIHVIDPSGTINLPLTSPRLSSRALPLTLRRIQS